MASEPHITDMYWSYYINNPVHGGKETCQICAKFVLGDKHGLCNDDFIAEVDPDTKVVSYFCKEHNERQTP